MTILEKLLNELNLVLIENILELDNDLNFRNSYTRTQIEISECI